MKKFQMSLKLGATVVMAFASLFATSDGLSVQGKMSSGRTPLQKPDHAIACIGRQNVDCKYFGLCKVAASDETAHCRKLRAQLSTNADGKVIVEFLDKPPEEGPTLFIDEDIAAPPAVATGLGFKRVTLLKGEYAYNSRRSVINARLVK